MKKLIFLLIFIPLISFSQEYTYVSQNKDTIWIACDTDIGKLIYRIWIIKPLKKQPVVVCTTQKVIVDLGKKRMKN